MLAAVFALVLAAVAPNVAAAAGWWTPPQHLTWFWQLQGKIDNSHAVAAYDVDGFETEASEVAALHAEGKRVICYIDVGTAENFRPDYKEFPKPVLGRSNGWPGERWLDIRQLGVIEPIMEKRFQMCREKGFDAVEPDNIEAFSNKSGFPITAAQQLEYDLWIANEVHSLGMAIFQKNDGEQSVQQEPYFDGALNEQCNQYRECADYLPYLQAGKPVLNAEYSQKNAKFCPADEAAGIMGARFAKSLNGKKFIPCQPS
ncbi:MAG TPA: endo alpha-1,4 polygalactosaminidase [Solirubrobacteraceae bacterium]|nr:endo alpha-1,4 polygalactosaminidase [Solirubrobacteraceae bacterium]